MDLAHWLPTIDRDLLFTSYENRILPIIDKLQRNEDIYQDAYNIVYYPESIIPIVQSSVFNVPEDAVENTVIGQVKVLNEGASPVTGFSLSGYESELFDIDENGYIALKSMLDYETQQRYHLKVRAQNSHGDSQDTEIYIQVKDILDAPVITGFSAPVLYSSLPAGTYAGKITFSPGSGTVNDISVSGNDSEYFDIDPEGNILISRTLENYQVKKSYSITVRVVNEFGESRPATIKFHVADRKELPVIKGFDANITENSPGGTYIGKIEILSTGLSDIEYFALYGVQSQDWTINNSGEIYVAPNAQIDFEKQQQYKISVLAHNSYGDSNRVSLTIKVNNTIDTPPTTYPVTLSIDENSAIGTIVGSVNAIQGEAPIEKYNLTGSGTIPFEIDSSGSVLLKGAIDYEQTRFYTFQYEADNSIGVSNGSAITVAVNDVPDVPATLRPFSLTRNYHEFTVGQSIGNILVSRGDSEITEIMLSPQSPFAVDNQGSMTLQSAFDGNQTSFSLTAKAISPAGESQPTSVTVNILAEPILAETTLRVDENADEGTVAGSIAITSEGMQPIDSFRFDGTVPFVIDANGTVRVAAGADIDFETQNIYTFDITASNQFGESNLVKLTINVNDLPEMPLVLQDINLTLSMGTKEGTVVGNVIKESGDMPIKEFIVSGSDLFDVKTNGDLYLKSAFYESNATDSNLTVYARTDYTDSNIATVQVKVVGGIIGRVDTSGYARDIVLSKDETAAYVADSEAGMQIIDITDPVSPQTIATVDTNDSVVSIALSSDERYAYVADGYGGIKIIDTEDMVLSADNTKLFLANGREGFKVIDVSNTSNMRVLGSLSLPNNARRIALSGDEKTAFVANEGNGMVILDVSDVASPLLLFTYGVSFSAWDLSYGTNNLVLLSDAYNSIHAVDVSSPNVPQTISTFWFGSSTSDITIAENGEFAIFGSGYDGIYLLDIRDLYAISSTYVIGSDSWNIANAFSLDTSKAFVLDYDGFRILDLTGF